MINSIQILRIVAAFGVVMAHYELFGLRAGGFGVDIFFIISGFIIAFVVNYSTKVFMKKRIARVVPLYAFATLLTTALALIKPEWFKNVIVNSEAVIKSLLYIPYRIESSGPILSLGWTLNNEMFFYIIMAICILLVKNKKYLALICGLIVLVIFVILNLIQTDSYILNFYASGLLPEFVMGILAYFIWKYLKKNENKTTQNLLIGLAIVSLIFMIYVDLTGEFKVISRNIWRGIPSFFVVLGTLMCEKYINSESKFTKFFVEMGDASYVMYLFHPYVLFGLERIVYPKVFGSTESVFIELVKFSIMVILLFVVCLYLYRFLDKPMAKYTRKLLKA